MEGNVATAHDDAFVMSPQFGDADLAEWFAGNHFVLKYKASNHSKIILKYNLI